MESKGEENLRIAKEYNLTSSKTYKPVLARTYFAIAAKEGNPEAMRSLALMLHQGTGGEKDLKEALKWLAQGYFFKNDGEAAEYLVDLLDEEVEDGRTAINDVDLATLALELRELKKRSTHVQEKLRCVLAGLPTRDDEQSGSDSN